MDKVAKALNFLGNLLVMDILFILTSTLSLGLCLGTSLTALYASFLELQTDSTSYYVRNYWKHFKGEFKSTIGFDVAILLLAGAAYLNYLMINSFTNDVLQAILYGILGLVIFEMALICTFLFPTIAKFEGNYGHHLSLAFYFAHKYLFISILFLIIGAVAVGLVIYINVVFGIIVFSFTGYVEALILKKIWKGYEYEVSEV
jgi:uncharacterized membrane protein YesL